MMGMWGSVVDAAAGKSKTPRVISLDTKCGDDLGCADEQMRLMEEEAKRLAEEKRKKEEEAKRLAEERRRKAEEAERLAEEERKKEYESKLAEARKFGFNEVEEYLAYRKQSRRLKLFPFEKYWKEYQTLNYSDRNLSWSNYLNIRDKGHSLLSGFDKSTKIADLSPSGELGGLFTMYSDYTDLQRENKLKEISRSYVLWSHTIYEVSKSWRHYRLVLTETGKVSVNAYIDINTISEEDEIKLGNMKTGSTLRVLGLLNDSTEIIRTLVLKPAIFVAY
jgi:hypothetical protein